MSKREQKEIQASTKRLDSELKGILEEISKNERQSEETRKRVSELEQKRTDLKTQKDNLEKELNAIRINIEEKQRLINTSNKFCTSNRDKEMKASSIFIYSNMNLIDRYLSYWRN